MSIALGNTLGTSVGTTIGAVTNKIAISKVYDSRIVSIIATVFAFLEYNERNNSNTIL